MKFSDIKGHDDVKRRLRDMADSDRIPHALLLEGEEGIGKLQMALTFAQYVHCEHRVGESHVANARLVCSTSQTITRICFTHFRYSRRRVRRCFAMNISLNGTNSWRIAATIRLKTGLAF